MPDSFKIERGSRTYEVDVMVGPLNPRTEYDHAATQMYAYGFRDTYVDEIWHGNPDVDTDDPVYTPWDWRQAVASDSTRLGYDAWVYEQRVAER